MAELPRFLGGERPEAENCVPRAERVPRGDGGNVDKTKSRLPRSRPSLEMCAMPPVPRKDKPIAAVKRDGVFLSSAKCRERERYGTAHMGYGIRTL
eukprot:2585116-Prymnesium_polylepis.1